MIGPHRRAPLRYEDHIAADDGNQGKAAISDACVLPRELSRGEATLLKLRRKQAVKHRGVFFTKGELTMQAK